MAARYAIYFAPTENTLLWHAGSAWLGRDARTGASFAQPAVVGVSTEHVRAMTASPRLYGLHATFKPPFQLADVTTLPDLVEATRALAARHTAFELPPLRVDTLSGFIALRTRHDSEALQRLAEACVAELDLFRRPPDAQELAKRRHSGLTPRQDALLEQFGYPYVLEEWCFHITLTERVAGSERDVLLAWLTRYFEEAVATPVPCQDLCVFVQGGPGEAFQLAERFALAPGRL